MIPEFRTLPLREQTLQTTVYSDGFVLDHRGASTILLTVGRAAGAAAPRVSHANAWLTPGSYLGQRVRVFVVGFTNASDGTGSNASTLRLCDGGQSTQVDLLGDFYVDTPWCWLNLLWDGTRWHEIGRAHGDWNTKSTGLHAMAAGRTSTARGIDAFSCNYGSDADAEDGLATGYGSRAWQRCAQTYANGNFVSSRHGDAQWERLLQKCATTDATPTPLTGPRGEEWTCKFGASQLDNMMFALKVWVMGSTAGGTNMAMWQRTILVRRAGGDVVVVAQGDTTSATGEWRVGSAGAAAWDIALAVSGNLVRVLVTGAAATAIRWVGYIEALELQHEA